MSPSQFHRSIVAATAVVILLLTDQIGTGIANENLHCLTNSIGMKLAYIPAGEFMREGSRVRISKAFLIGTTEVTQGQWYSVMRTSVSQQRNLADRSWSLPGEGDDYPMYYVNWDEAVEFCRKLSLKEGREYRLPTEAEWEYACRAGTTTAYHTGDTEQALSEAGWYLGNSDSRTQPVGRKRANAWGLYDMHGNVWEWCSDWHGSYPNGEVTDPTGPATGSHRVIRGGSWYYTPMLCRSARRGRDSSDYRNSSGGFRVVCVSDALPGPP